MVHSASSPATDGQVPRGSLSVQSSNATTPLANKQVDPPVCQPGFKQKFTMLPFSGRQEEKVRPYQVATQTITSVPPPTAMHSTEFWPSLRCSFLLLWGSVVNSVVCFGFGPYGPVLAARCASVGLAQAGHSGAGCDWVSSVAFPPSVKSSLSGSSAGCD